MQHRFSRAGLNTACLALLLGSAILVLPLAPAQAKQERRAAANGSKIAQTVAEPTTTSSISKTPGEEPGCNRARRRLWVEGEGWVVRRVGTCN